MCLGFKHIWTEITNVSKKWSMRRQMLVCYLMVMILVLSLVICLVLLNMSILREQILLEVEKTLSEEASDSMMAIIRGGGAYLYSTFSEVTIMGSFIREMLVNMIRDENSFSLDYLEYHTYEEIPESSLYTEAIYGVNSVSFNFSTFMNFSDIYDKDLLKKVSRFDNFWWVIYDLTNSTAIRYLIYFEQANFILAFPGLKFPDGYNPQTELWYTTFIENNKSSTATNAYEDKLGNGSYIFSLAEPLYHSDGSLIGIFVADINIQSISQEMSILNYIGYGEIALVYQNGDILKANAPGWWSNEHTNMNNISDNEFWSDVLDNPESIHYMIDDNQIHRVATYPISSETLNATSDWYYILMMFIKEQDIMQYKEDSKTEIENTGTTLILITIFTSVAIIIIIVVLIFFLSQSIRKPLQGIIDFTDKINANATEKDLATIKELENLKEGEDQIAKLVQAYKSLAGSLINRKEDHIPHPMHSSEYKEFYPNELYRTNILDLEDLIGKLKDQ
ncbi:unnamed protein product [Blepharisma stoltei]|uniref:Cache domain-containing protein n=1 Tax=Blepharisma stoltei TaxID=1481888 RepID=A0AAU9IE41_9CILI|nr:unnamed protein product [Blepharisma stoltei]